MFHELNYTEFDSLDTAAEVVAAHVPASPSPLVPAVERPRRRRPERAVGRGPRGAPRGGPRGPVGSSQSGMGSLVDKDN